MFVAILKANKEKSRIWIQIWIRNPVALTDQYQNAMDRNTAGVIPVPVLCLQFMHISLKVFQSVGLGKDLTQAMSQIS
jgi:hypothetical protein